jgi:TonB-linked SusC/RagA family outer membrane protein
MLSSHARKYDIEAGLRYQKQFNNHKLTMQAVYTLEDLVYSTFYARKEGVLDNSISVLDGTSINPEVGSGKDYRDKQIGTLGRILYDYKGKYLLSVSARYDGSSKFASKYRWGLFPSVSAAWNVSDEKFWSPIKPTINSFKVRLGRGTVGNNRFSSYSYAAGISFNKDYAFGPDASDVLISGAIQDEFSNAEVKWETSVQWNGGFDLAMFNNKLTFTGEIYDTQKKDMLFPVTIPASASGSDSSTPKTVTLNVGDMTNKGIELSLGYRAKTGKVNWGINSIFSTNENKITRMITDAKFVLTDDTGLMSGYQSQSKVTALAEGYEAGAFFIYETNGVVHTPEQLAAYKEIAPTAQMGDLIYVDQLTIDTDSDGIPDAADGKITESDRVYKGSGLPEYEVGLAFNADYKGFDFSMQWYSAIGHEIMNGSNAFAYSVGRHKDMIYAWSETNNDSPIPAYRGGAKNHDNYKGYTDLWLEDGTYLRLKNITLGYSFSQSLLKKIGIAKTRIYVTAQNPITITNYTGYDPEVGGSIKSRGLDKGNYPVTSLYVVGLNLNF